MQRAFQIMATIGCLFFSSLCASAQTRTHKIVLPNPQLIHCNSAQCSQLWKEDSSDRDAAYPAQILTDFVNGSIVGLTAVYNKSMSVEAIRTAINDRYATWTVKDLNGMWRVEPERLVIQLTERADGTKQLVYLQIGNLGSAVPSAHIDNCP
jgi:hypothetical protein